jgi:hypothetical protein
MPRFDVTAPNGQIFRVDTPEGATQDQAIAYVATEIYPRWLEENKPKPERGIGQLFTEGLKRGTAQTGVLLGDYLPAMLGRGVQGAAEGLGFEGLAGAAGSYAEKQLREAAQSELDISKKYPREFQSYEDITGPVSALRYGAEALGEGLPSIVPGIVTGGAGAFAARGLAAGARGLATAAATGAGSAAQTVPEAYASLLKETGKEEIGTALVAGGINAALESILPASLVGKMTGQTKQALVNSIKGRLGLGFVEGAAMEGLTEGMQEAVNKAAVSFVDDNKEFFTSENWKQILDSSIRGAIVGGPVTAVTSALSGGAPAEAPPAGPTTEAPPVTAPTDTPEQAAFRKDNADLLAKLNYQPQDIASIPFDELKDIVANKIPADEHFAKKQAPVKAVEEKPAEAGPPTSPEAPKVMEGPPTEVQPPVEQPPVATQPPVVQPPVATQPPVEQPPVAAQPPAPAPIPTPTPVVPTELPTISLPKNLAGAAPNYGYDKGLYTPQFVNDIDKALYITAGSKKSAKDNEYRQFLKDNGFNDAQIKSLGNNLRAYLKDDAKKLYAAGQMQGVIPVDYMRQVNPALYQQITGAKPTAPTPTAPGPTPAAPSQAPAWQTEYFGPLTEQGPSPETEFQTFDWTTDKKGNKVSVSLGPWANAYPELVTATNPDDIGAQLEAVIPGVINVLRTIHANLYPGTRLEIRPSRKENAFASYSPALNYNQLPGIKPLLTINVNMESFASDFKKAKDKQQFLLKTLFHELSHPLQYTLLNAVPDNVFNDVIQQYIKARNPSALERAFLKEVLTAGRDSIDPAFRTQFLQKMKFFDEAGKKALVTADPWDLPAPSEEILRKFMKDTGRKADQTLSRDLARDYIRSFNEWIAETGARWMTNELENIVPKTTFEKFQKTVLDGLRNVYRAVSEALGLTYSEGAFEKLLREVYGKRMGTAPVRSYEGTGRSQKQIKSIITRNLVSWKFTDQDMERMGIQPTDVEASATEPAPTPVPGPQTGYTKAWQNHLDVIGKEDGSVTGWFGRMMQKISGALPGESVGRAIVRNVVNSSLPFLESANDDVRNLGKFIEGMMNSTGRVMGAVTIAPLGYSRANKSFFFHSGPDVKSLLDVFKEVGVKNMDQAQIVFLAQRELALRKDRYITKKKESVLPEGTRVLTDQQLQEIIDSADPAVRKASEEFQKFNDKMVEMAVQTGLIPRKLGERFKTLMYTPMYRMQDDELSKNPNITLAGGIYDVLKDPENITTFNQRVGALGVGGPVAGNLYENILRNYNAIVSAGVRNVAYQETANTLTKLAQKGGDTTIAEVFNKPSDETIQFRVNGEDRYMKIYDPAMFAAVSALSPQEKNNFVRSAAWFTDVLRKGVTATPPFQLRNLIRGLVELKIKTGMPVFEILRGTLAGARDTWSKGDAYRDILGRTGFGGFGFGSGSKDQAAYMQRVYNSRERSWGEWRKYPNAFMRFFDKAESLGEVTEMAPRIAYYNYLKRNGMSDADAAWEAVNLVNYHRHGAGNGILGNVVSTLIPLTPFLTARIQGLYRLAETGTAGAPKNLIGNGYIGIPAAIVTRGLMVTAINSAVNMMYGDDDWYKKLSVKDRLSNMYVKVGDTVVVLPRAFEIGELFGGIPTLMLDSIRKQNGNDIAMGVGEFMKKTFLLEPVPQVVKPIAELYSNKNFYTGLPIENLSDKRSPKEERFDEYTSSFSKMAGHIGKYVELSPKQIDTLLRGYLGTSATLFLGTVDSLIGSAGVKPQGAFGDPNSMTGVAANLSGLGAIFKTESQLNNKFIGDFYEIKERVTQITQSINDAARRRDTDTIKARMEEMPQARGLYTAFNAASERLSQINGQMEAIRGRNDIPAEKKAELLEKMREMKGTIATQMVTLAERVGVTR